MSDHCKKSKITLEEILLYENQDSSNIKNLFESYGTSTLEAAVPVISDPVADKIAGFNPEERNYATLQLKAESANMALDGRRARTHNRELKTVTVAGQTFIAAGKVRERSPVDIGALERDLDRYHKEAQRIKAANAAGVPLSSLTDVDMEGENQEEEEDWGPSNRQSSDSSYNNKKKLSGKKSPLPEVETLDDQLDAYMREAKRKRLQAKKMAEQNEQSAVMERFENLACTEPATTGIDILQAIDISTRDNVSANSNANVRATAIPSSNIVSHNVNYQVQHFDNHNNANLTANDNNAVAVCTSPEQYELDYGDDDDL